MYKKQRPLQDILIFLAAWAAVKYISEVEINEMACGSCVYGRWKLQSSVKVATGVPSFSMLLSWGTFLFIFSSTSIQNALLQ